MRSAILLLGLLIYDGLVKREIPLTDVAQFLAVVLVVFFGMDLYELMRERK